MEKEKLDRNDTKSVVGGQRCIEDVMGVEGLSVCTGAPHYRKSRRSILEKARDISYQK